MVEVGKSRMTLKTLENMFLCPPDYYSDEEVNIQILHQEGLILKQVHYDENDFDYTEKDYEIYLEEKNKENELLKAEK